MIHFNVCLYSLFCTFFNSTFFFQLFFGDQYFLSIFKTTIVHSLLKRVLSGLLKLAMCYWQTSKTTTTKKLSLWNRQSVFRARCNTETALVTLVKDLRMYCDTKKIFYSCFFGMLVQSLIDIYYILSYRLKIWLWSKAQPDAHLSLNQGCNDYRYNDKPR